MTDLRDFDDEECGNARPSLVVKASQSQVSFKRLVVAIPLFFLAHLLLSSKYDLMRKAHGNTVNARLVTLDEVRGTALPTTNDTSTRPMICTWVPGQNEECQEALRTLICPKRQKQRIPRALFAGDSTMKRLYYKGGFLEAYQEVPMQVMGQSESIRCTSWNAQRCELNKFFGFPYRETWEKPRELEGPLSYGLDNAYCQDCSSCTTSMTTCELQETKPIFSVGGMTHEGILSFSYGAYVAVEFARDVEMQTDIFRTTQENVALYLQQNWGHPSHLGVWEQPTCVINTGHHDVQIEAMTQEVYVENVRWYLHIMAKQCKSIVWISTSSPASDDFAQKILQTKEWGLAIRELLKHDSILTEKSIYVDLYEASKSYGHRDNVHLVDEWYHSLSELFRPETLFDCQER